ncbi:hypothetical protein PPERSA_11904 [Pseudocohnilembus persalinus]|uniref:Uncharacterized protein n=1 Tax=Pseudocohnilembus persalinus TaxID=266149 RepID=A0A0V0QK65_PSEPJ|nr:hypothetical protein PPERSA_11904 [Pseudocohnilembus persalinus]|eukprot:KRX02564.1 hypothetical protein PPERSA_11904 [Pseudocohnilembus persalinus]
MNRYLQQNSNSDLNQLMQAINSDSPVNQQKRLLKWDSHSIGHINDGQKVFKNKQYSSKIAEIRKTNQSQQIENNYNMQNPSISIYRAHEKQNTFSYAPAINANSAKLIQETQKSQQSLKSFQTQTSQISQQQHVFDKESPIQVENSKLWQPYDMKNQGLNMLVYGTKCELYQKLKQNKQQECVMALDPYIEYQIQLMDFQNNFQQIKYKSL